MNSTSEPPAIRTWALMRASPVLAGLVALHVLTLLAIFVRPGAWLTWIALLLGVHAAVILLVLQPRNRLFGPNLTRLPAAAAQRGEVALTFDDGPDAEVTPQVLDILDAFGARASFFMVGTSLQACPDLARQIVARGHSLENHSARHLVLFSLLGVDAIRQEVEQLQASALAIAGVKPRFFRPPAGFHSPLVSPLLVRIGLQLATWTRRGFDTRDHRGERVLRRLTRNLSAGDILLLHDGNGARDGNGTPVVLQVLPLLLRTLEAQGLHAVSLPQAIFATPAPSAERR
jgi:peptidoglycan/xylan/chitin deacetylase (PgdA/CDA1 family)